MLEVIINKSCQGQWMPDFVRWMAILFDKNCKKDYFELSLK